jgi:hypothetical protein
MESFARWRHLPEVSDPAAGVDLHLVDGLLTVRVLFSKMIGGLSQDLVLTFRQPVAVSSFDEFQHPWNFEPVGDLPRLTGKWANYAYPLLAVNGSAWVTQAEGNGRENLQHLRIVTLGDTVDVVGSDPDSVSWDSGDH